MEMCPLLPWKPAPARTRRDEAPCRSPEAMEELLFRRKDVTGGPDEKRV